MNTITEVGKGFLLFSLALSFAFAGVQLTYAAAPDGDGPWADAVVDYSPGQRDDGTPVDPARAIEESALGVAEDGDSINFAALGYGGSITLSFENGIANGEGADFEVVETTYNNNTCDQYPERATLEVSEDGITWHDAVTASDCQDLEFDLEDLDLQCIVYVRITDATNADDFNVGHITDGYDVDGVRALHAGTCEPETDFEYQCDAGFLYLDVNNSSTEADLYLVDTGNGAGELKKTYSGDFRNNLAADSEGNVFAIDRTTKMIVQLMPDGTTVNIAQTELPSVDGTLAIAPDDTMYIALNNDELYSIDMDGTTVSLTTLQEIDVQGGDIAVNEDNVMTIINTEGEAWTVDLGNGYAVANLGNIGTTRITGMTYADGVYYVTNDTDKKVYSFTHTTITAVELGSFGADFGSGDAASCAPERLEASVSVEKSAEGYVSSPFEVNADEDVTYTYAVTNDGQLSLTNVVVEDDKCDSVEEPTDDNGNGKLDIGETWNYSCTQTMTELGSVINTVSVNGNDSFGDPVEEAQDTFETVVKAYGCTLTQGYWKTHGDPLNEKKYDSDWAVFGEEDDIKSEVDIMTTQSKGNYWYMLYSQYTAAYLNSQTAWTPAPVQDALVDALALLNPENREALALKGKKKDKALHAQFVSVSGILTNYNEGDIGPGHCSDY